MKAIALPIKIVYATDDKGSIKFIRVSQHIDDHLI